MKRGRRSIQSPGSSVTEELTIVSTNGVEDVELQVALKLKIVDQIIAGIGMQQGTIIDPCSYEVSWFRCTMCSGDCCYK